MVITGKSATVTEKILEWFGFLPTGFTKETFSGDIYLPPEEVKSW